MRLKSLWAEVQTLLVAGLTIPLPEVDPEWRMHRKCDLIFTDNPGRIGSNGLGSGACQGSCRSGHAASAVLSWLGRDAVLTTTSRSGFKATAPIGSQLRVWRDQRAGLRSRAWRYSA